MSIHGVARAEGARFIAYGAHHSRRSTPVGSLVAAIRGGGALCDSDGLAAECPRAISAAMLRASLAVTLQG